MSYRYANPGFAAAAKRGRSKSFEERVEIGIKRFKAALIKMGGAINAQSEGDMVDFGLRHVHNRDRELGDHRNGEFRKVIVTVVKYLLRRDCEYDPEHGLLILNERFMPPRQHRQKYPRGYISPRTA